jgi:hypothetical protein
VSCVGARGLAALLLGAALVACAGAVSSSAPRPGESTSPRHDVADAAEPARAGLDASLDDARPPSAAEEELFSVASRDEGDQDFAIVIEREHADARRARLIAEAEELCSVSSAGGSRLRLDASPAEGAEPCRWWSTEVSSLRIPATITQGVLEHYVSLIEQLRSGAAPITNDGPLQAARFTYRASVERHAVFIHRGRRFFDVDVVRMELSWTQFCAGTCAFGFSLIRQVLFFDDEEPISLGDGEAAVWGS